MFVASFDARCEAEARRVNQEYAESQPNITAHGRLHIARRELHVHHDKPIFLVTVPHLFRLHQHCNHIFSYVTHLQRKSCLILVLALPSRWGLAEMISLTGVLANDITQCIQLSTGQQRSFVLRFVNEDASIRFHDRCHGVRAHLQEAFYLDAQHLC